MEGSRLGWNKGIIKLVKKSKKRFDKWKKNLIMTNVRLVRPLTFYIL